MTPIRSHSGDLEERSGGPIALHWMERNAPAKESTCINISGTWKTRGSVEYQKLDADYGLGYILEYSHHPVLAGIAPKGTDGSLFQAPCFRPLRHRGEVNNR